MGLSVYHELKSLGTVEESDNNCMALANVTYIRNALSDLTQNFFRLGFYLWEANQHAYYFKCGYDNVYDYANVEFELSPTTTKNLISVYSFCCIKDNYICTNRFNEFFKNYSFSQLVEIARLKFGSYGSAADKINNLNISSNMTVREIREIIQKYIRPGKSDVGLLQINEKNVEKLPETQVESHVISAADIEEVKENSLYETISFKNDDARWEFLRHPEKWEVWLEIPTLSLKIRRVSLSNGAIILAYSVLHIGYDNKLHENYWLHYFKNESEIRFRFYDTGDSQIVDIIRTEKLSAYILKAENV